MTDPDRDEKAELVKRFTEWRAAQGNEELLPVALFERLSVEGMRKRIGHLFPEEIEAFDLVEYMEENGWDAGKVCQLTDKGAQQVIAMWVVEATRAIEGFRYKRAKENANQALQILEDEFEAGRTRQAEREAARAAEKEIG